MGDQVRLVPRVVLALDLGWLRVFEHPRLLRFQRIIFSNVIVDLFCNVNLLLLIILFRLRYFLDNESWLVLPERTALRNLPSHL